MVSTSVLEQLLEFYESISDDTRIGPYHICLYISLIRLRSRVGWKNPINIYRAAVMKDAKMSRKTYNKCMSDLAHFGYLKYEPSTNPAIGSKVYFNKL